MPQATIYTIKGTKNGRITLPSSLFNVKVNKDLLAQSVRTYLAGKRKASAKTKTRGEIKGSRRKIWPQKGTGRARHGDRYAPIFVGGGIAHGPTGEENYTLKFPKKMRRQALGSALTFKLKEKKVLVVDSFEKVSPKTQKMVKILEGLGVFEKKGEKLLVLAPKEKNAFLASRNIVDVKPIVPTSLNPYQVLKAEKIIFSKDALSEIKKIFVK